MKPSRQQHALRGTHPGSLRQPADVPRNVTENNPPGHFKRLGVSRSEVVLGQECGEEL